MENLIKQIEAAFADSDAQSIADVPRYVEEARELYRTMETAYYDAKKACRRKEISEYECNQKKKALYSTFSNQFMNDCDWGKDEHIAREIKRVEDTHEARNARIAIKMAKAGITTIDADDFTILYGKDFTGLWIIDGFQVKIQVIWAGGYNIQKLHHRVLVSVKPIKIKKAA